MEDKSSRVANWGWDTAESITYLDILIVLSKCTEGNSTKADGYVLQDLSYHIPLCYLTYLYYWLLMQTTRLYWFLTVPLTTIPSFRRESSHRLQFYTVSSSELLYALCSTRYCVGGYGTWELWGSIVCTREERWLNCKSYHIRISRFFLFNLIFFLITTIMRRLDFLYILPYKKDLTSLD